MDIDLLKAVRKRLADDVGNLRRVSADSGIPYDTILRIKNGEGDPGYSKVHALSRLYGITAQVGAGDSAPIQEAA
jgi:hypothetical protein